MLSMKGGRYVLSIMRQEVWKGDELMAFLECLNVLPHMLHTDKFFRESLLPVSAPDIDCFRYWDQHVIHSLSVPVRPTYSPTELLSMVELYKEDESRPYEARGRFTKKCGHHTAWVRKRVDERSFRVDSFTDPTFWMEIDVQNNRVVGRWGDTPVLYNNVWTFYNPGLVPTRLSLRKVGQRLWRVDDSANPDMWLEFEEEI